ncbi:hypothetical protein Agub_g3583 [Astrephomene gubernaculifera]|uniref:CHASE domain-containing protein n=1 Tax=Astrephomene gubernaculifera TaxID=47775 RepID=A0AAD3DMP9_9CHLO|nr:hypothetical protein Agub_g3583 [Astrephomene gubernaculifera]
MSLQAQREDGFRPGGRTSWTRRPQAAIQETTRIVRVFPSTLLWPLALLGILLGVGIWGVTRALQMDDNSAKDRASRLAMETAEWFRFQVQMAAAPVTLMAAMVNYNPQYEAASGLFRGLAPTLMSQTPLTQRAKALELAPHGVTRDVFPAPPNGVMGYDIFNSTLPGDTEGATRAVQQGQATLVGPLSYMQSDRVLIVRNPVFISGVASDETFGIAAPSSYGSCGEPCAYNATTRTKFWGFVSTLIDLQGIIQAEDSKLKKLGTLGYRFEVEAMGAAEADLRRVAASSALPTNPVEANVTLPNGNWVVRVAPKHGWTPRLYSGLLAAVVIFAVAVSLLLFWALLSRARHKILVEALLPRNLSPASGSEDGPRCQHSETAADMLLGMLSDLLEGYAPDIGDVLFIRTVLMRNMDVYQPLNLRGHIKGGNLDADVVQSLMQQLGEGSPLSAFKLEVEAEDGAGAGGLSRKPSSIVPHNLDTIAGTLSFLLSPDGLLYGGDSRVSLNARLGSSAGDAAAAMAHFAVPVSPSPCGVVSRQSSSGSMCSRIRAKQRRASVSSVMRAFSSTEATTTENEACGAACDGDVEALGAVGSLAATASGDEAIASLPSSRQPPGVRPVSMVASLRPVSSSGLGARFMSFVRGRRGSMDACMFGEGAVELQKRPSRLGLKLSAREGGPMSPSVTGEGGGYVPSEAVAEAAASTTCNVVLRVAVSLSEVRRMPGGNMYVCVCGGTESWPTEHTKSRAADARPCSPIRPVMPSFGPYLLKPPNPTLSCLPTLRTPPFPAFFPAA